MEIDVTCPQCKNEAMSKIRKVISPGIMLVCKSCQAENLGHPLLETNKLSILSLTTNPSLVRFTALTILEPEVITNG